MMFCAVSGVSAVQPNGDAIFPDTAPHTSAVSAVSTPRRRPENAPRNIIYACIKSGTRAAWYARVKPGYSPAPHWSLRKNIFLPASVYVHASLYMLVYLHIYNPRFNERG